jgi:hypothetical protein
MSLQDVARILDQPMSRFVQPNRRDLHIRGILKGMGLPYPLIITNLPLSSYRSLGDACLI